MKCDKCESELIVYKLAYSDFQCCMKCGQHSRNIELESCCRDPKQYVRKHKTASGVVLRKQCQTCGFLSGQSVKKAEHANWENYSFTDTVLGQEYQTKKWQQFSDYQKRYLEHFRKKVQEERSEKYQQYLKSEQWHKKRGLVLSRDQYVCKACNCRTATEVHHLTYAHIYNEPLFDLIAVCRECHESITAMDQQREFTLITHPINQRINRAS